MKKLGPILTSHPLNWSHPLNRGLVGYWLVAPGFMGGLRLRDLTGANHGTLTNMTMDDWVGRPGGFGALDFDGVDDYVDVGDQAVHDFGSATDFTVSLWMRADVWEDSTHTIFKGGNINSNAGWGIRTLVGTPNSIQFLIGDGSSRVGPFSGTGAVANTWIHVMGVAHRGDTIKLYVNGSEVHSVSDTLGNIDSDDSLNIGSGFNSSATPVRQFFDGKIDDIRIYNRALSATEVQQLYQLSLQGYPGVLNRAERVDGLSGATSIKDLIQVGMIPFAR